MPFQRWFFLAGFPLLVAQVVLAKGEKLLQVTYVPASQTKVGKISDCCTRNSEGQKVMDLQGMLNKNPRKVWELLTLPQNRALLTHGIPNVKIYDLVDTKLDTKGANLPNAIVDASLSNMDFSGSELPNLQVQKNDLIHNDFRHATLTHAKSGLKGANPLKGTDPLWKENNFGEANLQGAQIGPFSVFSKNQFNESKLGKTVWRGTFDDGENSFRDADLWGSSFLGAKVTPKFLLALLQAKHISWADLNGVTLLISGLEREAILNSSPHDLIKAQPELKKVSAFPEQKGSLNVVLSGKFPNTDGASHVRLSGEDFARLFRK